MSPGCTLPATGDVGLTYATTACAECSGKRKCSPSLPVGASTTRVSSSGHPTPHAAGDSRCCEGNQPYPDAPRHSSCENLVEHFVEHRRAVRVVGVLPLRRGAPRRARRLDLLVRVVLQQRRRHRAAAKVLPRPPAGGRDDVAHQNWAPSPLRSNDPHRAAVEAGLGTGHLPREEVTALIERRSRDYSHALPLLVARRRELLRRARACARRVHDLDEEILDEDDEGIDGQHRED